MSYQLSNKIHWFPGMAFGHKQPSCIVNIEFSHQDFLRANPQRVLSFLDPFRLEEMIDAQPNSLRAMVDFFCHSYIALQNDLGVPVFNADCGYVISAKRIEENRYFFQLSLPCVVPNLVLSILQWLADALFSELASEKDLQSQLATIQSNLKKYGVGGTNTINLLEAAYKKGIKTFFLVGRIYSFGHGSSSLWLNSTFTEKTPLLGNSVAKDKYNCASLLKAYGLPVPLHALALNQDQACRIAKKLGYPVVVKPANLDQGAGVAAGISSETTVIKAYLEARKLSDRILVEKHVDGCDFRITILHGKVIKVMQRFAGGLIGDGKSTATELVELSQASSQSKRVYKREGKFRLDLDEEAISLLKERGYHEDSVIPMNEFIPLRRKNNISTGGAQKLVHLDQVHPDNQLVACRAAEVLGLDIAGVDLIIPDIGSSWRSQGGVICEVNGQPQIGKTDTPEIFSEILDLLMPKSVAIPLYLEITIGLSPKDQIHASMKSAKTHGCNGVSVLNQVFFNEREDAKPLRNGFEAAVSMLIDRRVDAGVISMKAEEVLLFGLPTFLWTDIKIIHSKTTSPEDLVFKKVLNLLHRYHFDVDVLTY